MNGNGFDPDKAARRLAAAWKQQSRITSLSPDETPLNLEEAYSIQSRLMALLGQGMAGWKGGGTSPRSLRGDAATPPCFGRLLASRVFKRQAVRPVPADTGLLIELEVAFQFRRTVYPSREPLDLPTMIDGALAAFEVVRSRFVDHTLVGHASFVADNAGFDALVYSDQALSINDLTRLGERAEVWCGDTLVRQALSEDERTDPLTALQFIWQQLAMRDLSIGEGDIVTTGTLVAPIHASGAGQYEGRIGEAVVQIEFAA
jgi:2-keto-4-pentenoate hydratase